MRVVRGELVHHALGDVVGVREIRARECLGVHDRRGCRGRDLDPHPGDGRYIARFDDLTLSLNYLRARSEVPAGEALDLLMADVLRAYGRAET